MLKKFSILLFFIPFFVACQSKQNDKVSITQDFTESIIENFNGEIAYQSTAFVEKYWRVVGNSGFNTSIDHIVNKLQEAGFKEEKVANTEDILTYRIEKRSLERPTWEPIDAKVFIDGESKPLLQFESNRNMLAINSYSTKEEGVVAEVVKVNGKGDIKKSKVSGKIVFSEIHPYAIFKAAMEAGAVGIITYNNPDYLQPQKNTTSIQFKHIPLDKKSKSWSVSLSYAAKEKLNQKLKEGKTVLKVNIKTKIYKSEELTVVANIKGSINPNERLVFSAHVQEPGANDNASGVGLALEMASLTAQLIKKGDLSLNRTLTFLWGDEIISTRRYVKENSKKTAGIKWGISLDMVGENTEKTGGTFLIEKMPDPSAIWTRGNDKHTEWGGDVMKLEDMKPHYLNDFLINRFLEQGKRTNWKVNTNPFEGGSDHEPFLRAGIPSVLFWHFTDQFYHTDNDRFDKVSKSTLKNVGTAALISATKLLNADKEAAILIIDETKKAGVARLQEELNQSKKAIAEGAKIASQKEIIKAWEDWYVKALDSCSDLIKDASLIKTNIDSSQKEIRETAKKCLLELEK